MRETIMVEPGAGTPASVAGPLAGSSVVFKIRGEQTSGAFSIVEFVAGPGFFVPPHRHERTAEISYVLEGELGVMVAEEEFQARAGSFVVRPKGVPHALWNATDRPVKLLDVYTPAGFEAFYEELGRLFSSTPPPTIEQRNEAARRHDTIFFRELAPPLVRKYNLRMPG
jgi:quercetin dioxygenase-like cupin family protein